MNHVNHTHVRRSRESFPLKTHHGFWFSISNPGSSWQRYFENMTCYMGAHHTDMIEDCKWAPDQENQVHIGEKEKCQRSVNHQLTDKIYPQPSVELKPVVPLRKKPNYMVFYKGSQRSQRSLGAHSDVLVWRGEPMEIINQQISYLKISDFMPTFIYTNVILKLWSLG